MKKTFFSIVLMSALFTVVSCSKSFDPSEEGTSNATVFTATIEEGTKTTLDETKVKWVKDDQISVMDANSKCAIYKATTGGATTTNFEHVSGETSLTSPYTAYYPSSLLVETTPTLPATQTYDDTNPFSIYPMYASSNDLNLNFKNICGVLAITIQDINVKTINISSSDKAMSGSFTVDANNNAVLDNPNNASNSVTLDCGEGVSTSTAKIFYIPIPAQTYNDIRIIVNNESYMVTKKSSITIARNTIYSFTYSGTNIPTPSTLSGEFSVSTTKKVKFSQGNLQASIDASGNPTGWKFATNQYDIVGNEVANNSIGKTAGDIDLFGWSTDGTGVTSGIYKPWGINNSQDVYDYGYYGNFVDWGSNPALISALGTGWYTLTKDEWYYLVFTRTVNGGTGKEKSYQQATINSDATGVYGMILYPDNYTSQTGATSYTFSQWSTMEAAGCVFLPASGYREGKGVGYLTDGNYWSSTPSDANCAYGLYFTSDDDSEDVLDDFRKFGFLVRLVREYK